MKEKKYSKYSYQFRSNDGSSVYEIEKNETFFFLYQTLGKIIHSLRIKFIRICFKEFSYNIVVVVLYKFHFIFFYTVSIRTGTRKLWWKKFPRHSDIYNINENWTIAENCLKIKVQHDRIPKTKEEKYWRKLFDMIPFRLGEVKNILYWMKHFNGIRIEENI